MLRISAICLGQNEKLTGNYETMQELNDAIFAKFRKYLVKGNVKEKHVNFILTYMEKSENVTNIPNNEKLLEDINVIKKHGDQWFQLYVKRIWDACCQCISPFGITPGQMPYECENPKCGHQYCSSCVNTMSRVQSEDKPICCMYCGNLSAEGPIENRLLLDLLWDQYLVKYGAMLLSTTNIMPRTLSNDIECRVIHLQSLVRTLKSNITQNISVPELIDSKIGHANILIEHLEKMKEKTDEFLPAITAHINDNQLNDCSNEYERHIIHLNSLIRTFGENIDQNTTTTQPTDSRTNHASMLIEQLEKVREQADKFLPAVIDRIDENKLYDYSNEYVKLLTGDHEDSRKCEHFISVCEQLLYYNQEVEFAKHFPLLNNKMNEWESLSHSREQYQPKIIDVFRAMESDLGHHIIPSIPCRVGFIGARSAGKSSLLNWLRRIRDENNSSTRTNNDHMLFSPVREGKSTYCRLEFEHQYANGQKVIFVDVEGSNDTDTYLKSANYFEEISKADCDLYLIVFDNDFTDIQQRWYDYIVSELGRECWLARSKVDQLFRRKFKENVGRDFDSVTNADRDTFGERTIKLIRDEVSLDIREKKLSNVYLTFTAYDKNFSQILCSNFDMEKLINDIQQLPLGMHEKRLQKMAVRAMARVINNCFRRGYVVNVMKYNIAAGVAAVVPLADLIPRYFGREKIRQVFGVSTRSRFMNWWYNTEDELQDYLADFGITVDDSGFRTSAFKKTFQKNLPSLKHSAKEAPSVVAKGAAAVGVAGVSVTDNVLRGVGIGATTAVRGVSAAFIIAGAVLTVGGCVWAAMSNGKQMCNYLNRLCDDLIFVSDCVAEKTIAINGETRDSFSHTT